MTVVDLTLLNAAVPGSTRHRTFLVADESDFERFFLHSYDGLIRSLTAITGNRPQAEDCVQEAFIRASGRWHRVRRMDNPTTWVRRVAINLSHDMHRSDRRRRRREDRDRENRPASTPSPTDDVDAGMDMVQLLERLTVQQRAVAALFYVEDLPIRDIAESLELSTGAVKFHLNKARQSLRQILETSEVSSV
jgi:RNA polymerase sigma-70 factor (ECF subfamily)